MSSDFWGMTAFFISTLVLLIVCGYLWLKVRRLQQLLGQQKGKASQDQSPSREKQ
jgi:hypothetical protein